MTEVLDYTLTADENQWRERLSRAIQWVDQESPAWKQNLELYNGKLKHMENRRYEYYVNPIYQIYKTDKSQVCPLGLDFYVEVDGEDRTSELNLMVSALLNNQLATFENVKTGRRLHSEATAKGMGIAVIYIDSVEERDNIELDGEIQSVPKSKDRMRVVARPLENVLYDKSLADGDIENLPWLAVSYNITAQKFKDNPKYDHKTIVLKMNGIEDPRVPTDMIYTNLIKTNDTEGGYKDPRFAPIRIWEVWDVQDRKKLHIEAKSYKIVMEEDYPVDTPEFNFPFVAVSWTDEDVVDFPPVPEINYIKDAVEAFHKVRSAQVRDVKRGVRHIIYNEKAFTPDKIAKITDADKDQCIPFNDNPLNTVVPTSAQNLIQQLPDLQPLPDAHQMAVSILGDIQQTSGYGPMERAGMPNASTATETNTIAGFMADRRRAKLYEMLNFWQKVAKKSLILMAKFFPEKIIINTGKYGQPAVWKEFEKSALEGKMFNVKVYVGSEGITDRQKRLAEDLQVANILAPIAQQVGADMSMIIRKTLAMREWTPDEINSMFKGNKEKAKALAMLFVQSMEGGMDELEAMKFIGALTDFLKSYLTPEDIAELQGKFKATGGQAPNQQTTPGVAGQRQSMLPLDMMKVVTK